jgi:hypothetical protein
MFPEIKRFYMFTRFIQCCLQLAAEIQSILEFFFSRGLSTKPWKNMPIYPCKKFLKGTDGVGFLNKAIVQIFKYGTVARQR